jgi:hypothetical protein
MTTTATAVETNFAQVGSASSEVERSEPRSDLSVLVVESIPIRIHMKAANRPAEREDEPERRAFIRQIPDIADPCRWFWHPPIREPVSVARPVPLAAERPKRHIFPGRSGELPHSIVEIGNNDLD